MVIKFYWIIFARLFTMNGALTDKERNTPIRFLDNEGK